MRNILTKPSLHLSIIAFVIIGTVLASCGDTKDEDEQCKGEVRWICDDCDGYAPYGEFNGEHQADVPCDAEHEEAAEIVERDCDESVEDLDGYCICDASSCHKKTEKKMAFPNAVTSALR